MLRVSLLATSENLLDLQALLMPARVSWRSVVARIPARVFAMESPEVQHKDPEFSAYELLWM
jgi:hypothetical protein